MYMYMYPGAHEPPKAVKEHIRKIKRTAEVDSVDVVGIAATSYDLAVSTAVLLVPGRRGLFFDVTTRIMYVRYTLLRRLISS